MLYREFGKTGWRVSAVAQGCWNIGNQWGQMDEATADSIIKTAYDNGMNLFDVAESYGIPNGLCELRLGKALKGFRDKVYLVTKIGHWGARTGQDVPKNTPDMIRLCGHACLGRLRTESIDVMLCHEADIQDPSIYIEAFEQLRAEGFIREYGISTDSLEVLKRFNDRCGGKCAVAEIDYSLIHREPETNLLPYCRENGMAVLVRGPLARGVLAGKYDAGTVFTDTVRQNWNKGKEGRKAFEAKLAKVEKVKAAAGEGDLATTALRYVISHVSKPVAIPGATSPRQALANAKAGETTLADDELQALNVE